jgi:nodulation protein E
MSNAGASFLSMELGVLGPTLTLSTACSSANHAIGLAGWMVRHGMCDVALAGGSEAPFTFR